MADKALVKRIDEMNARMEKLKASGAIRSLEDIKKDAREACERMKAELEQ